MTRDFAANPGYGETMSFVSRATILIVSLAVLAAGGLWAVYLAEAWRGGLDPAWLVLWGPMAALVILGGLWAGVTALRLTPEVMRHDPSPSGAVPSPQGPSDPPARRGRGRHRRG